MKVSNKVKFSAVILLAASQLYTTKPVAAAVPENALLDEVIVTARKREESLTEVPISITAVSGKKLQDYAIRSVQDAAQLVPNLYVDEVAAGPRISIRGLGNAQTGGVLDSSVGLGIDGLFYGRPRWLAAGLFDVESVEVLRGPQSTFFGKNTTAGLVNISTRGPGDVLEGFIDAGYETEVGGYNLSGAVSIPLTETLAIRIAARHTESDGFLDVIGSGDEHPEKEEDIARLTVAWDPTDNVALAYKVTYLDAEIDGAGQEFGACSDAFITLLAVVGSAEDCRLNRRRNRGGNITGGQDQAPDGTTNEGQSHVLSLDWDLSGFTLSSVTGYHDLDSNWRSDGDWIEELEIFHVHRPEEFEQFSQELRLASPVDNDVSYVVGVYYDETERKHNQNLDVTGFSSIKTLRVESESWAVFGELTWNLTERLRMVLGARYTEEEQDARIDEIQGFPSPIVTPAYDVRESRDTDDLSPSVTLQYDLNDSGLVYFSYKEGFKVGGYDLDFPAVVDNDGDGLVDGWAFGDESVESYELGAKLELFDSRLLLTGAVFQTEFSDLQVQAYTGTSISVTTVNAAESTVRGIELEASWAASQSVLVNASIGYTDSEYDSFPGAPCFQGQGCTSQDLSGVGLPLSPDVSGAIGVEWHTPLTATHELQIGANLTYQDEVFLTLEQDPLASEDSVTLVAARLALLPESGKGWRAALVGRNIFDKNYVTGAVPIFAQAGTYVYQVAPPRTLEFQVGYDF